MGWKASWLGSDDPTRSQVIGNISVLGICVLVPLGMFVDFVPAPALHAIDMKVLFLIVGLIESALLFGYAARKGRLSRLMDEGILRFVFVLCCAPFVFGLISCIVLVKSLPWMYTRPLGSEFRESHVMETHYKRSRRGCDYRLRGGPMERSFPNYLCISEAFYRRHPEDRVNVILTGKRSVFGDSIQRIESDD